LSVTVGAVNDAPVQSGTITPITVSEDFANTTASSLGLTGLTYGITALIGTAIFAGLSFQVALRRESDPANMQPERRLFKYSMLYLFILYGAVVADRWMAAA